MSTDIEKMVQLAKENEGFKNQLESCKTAEDALNVLKENNINVTMEEFNQFTKGTNTKMTSSAFETQGSIICVFH